MDFSLIKCTEKDLDLLQDISYRTYDETFSPYNSPDIMQAYFLDAFNKQKLLSELLDTNSQFYFLFVGDELAGYLKVNEAPSQSDVNDVNSLEIERLYVLKKFQRNGLGAYLMEMAIDMAISKGKSYVWLGVWERNEKALRFYKKQGYYKIGEHPFYMGSDKQTDYLMRKDLR